jgi:hypothetical protein
LIFWNDGVATNTVRFLLAAALPVAIFRIILCGAKEEVVRIRAWTHIALVQHHQPLWDLSLEQPPGCPVGSLLELLIEPRVNPAVPVFVIEAGPQPAARIRLGMNLF